jgi:hypothetical protein
MVGSADVTAPATAIAAAANLKARVATMVLSSLWP